MHSPLDGTFRPAPSNAHLTPRKAGIITKPCTTGGDRGQGNPRSRPELMKQESLSSAPPAMSLQHVYLCDVPATRANVDPPRPQFIPLMSQSQQGAALPAVSIVLKTKPQPLSPSCLAPFSVSLACCSPGLVVNTPFLPPALTLRSLPSQPGCSDSPSCSLRPLPQMAS